jgi:hypothetical protein
MATWHQLLPNEDRPTVICIAGRVPSESQGVVYCNPCLGIPPILIESPARYLGVQMVAGVSSLLALLVFEALR